MIEERTGRKQVFDLLNDTPMHIEEIRQAVRYRGRLQTPAAISSSLCELKKLGCVKCVKRGYWVKVPGSHYAGEKPKRGNRHTNSTNSGAHISDPVGWDEQKTTRLTLPPSRERCHGGACAWVRPKPEAVACGPCADVIADRAERVPEVPRHKGDWR